MVQSIFLSSVVVDERYQPRQALVESEVQHYANQFLEGAEFPPIVVFKNQDDTFTLASGFHRFEVYKRLKLNQVEAEIREGTPLEILVEAIQSNSRHGIKYTNDDKWRCVSMLLKNEEATNWSDNHLGKICGVSNHLVKKVRLELYPDKQKDPTIVTVKDGKELSLDTTNIGPSKSAEKPSLQSINAKLNSKTIDIVRTLSVFKEVYSQPDIEIPDELDKAIHEFVSWYSSKQEVAS